MSHLKARMAGLLHKCLRAGEYCKRNKNSEYHRYGFHCRRSTGRLTYY